MSFAALKFEDLHRSLLDPALTAMTFLNEVAGRYPDAVSFAAGRPAEEGFDIADVGRYVERFRRYLRAELGLGEEAARRVLLQYGRTKGVIHELIARHLQVDEHIMVDAESLVVTVGCQEAMFLVLRALQSAPEDILLVVSPAYVGITGAAALVDLPLRPVSSGTSGIDFDDLRRQVVGARAEGLRPRALYVVPDFANPTGLTLDLATRRGLLDVADEVDLLLIEDNAYGMFAGSVEPLPTLKAMDEQRRVVYLGSFAKTVLPGARIGYAVADQRVRHGDRELLLADVLATVKSVVSVNTSPIAQAVIAGKLLENDFSLRRANAGQAAFYLNNMRLLCDGLNRRLGADAGPGPRIRWNVPAGGFFLVVTVPFEVTDQLLEQSAARYGVLWTPMRHFHVGAGGEHQMRLSCSSLSPEDIDVGLDRLTAFINDQCGRS
jgi:(S)-3,5-dihydroxyphenylglycine transaminase